MLEIFASFRDEVISSDVATGKCDYQFAIDNFFPLINRYNDQRKIQNKKFYERLKKDILDGCVMPAITVAFVDENSTNLSPDEMKQFVLSNIRSGYVLDGIQRINTLNNAAENQNFKSDGTLLINVIIAPSQDKLLYRMITLNNGQKPMSARHQIEILTSEMFNFSNYQNIHIKTEKDTTKTTGKKLFKLGSIAKSYLAFLTNNINNENNKIIESKMDEILVGRLFEVDIKDQVNTFYELLTKIDQLCEEKKAFDWLKVENNLVAFCVGAKNQFRIINNISPQQFTIDIEKFDEAFIAFDPSKLNVGRFRRQLASEYFSKYDKLSHLDSDELLEYFSEFTAQ